jgi:hypothetical protein
MTVVAAAGQGDGARAQAVGPARARRRLGRASAVTWTATVLLALLALVAIDACGGGGSGQRAGASKRAASAGSTTAAPPEDLVMTAADFRNIHTMTRVRGFFVDNRLGHLAEALRVANSPGGGTYPVGTILQLVPQEAMVKRRTGFSPATHDWEFFSLQTTAAGTAILTRGGAEVVNRFGGSCASCHSPALAKFDGVCGQNGVCAPLPIGPKIIAAVQQADPRPLHKSQG